MTIQEAKDWVERIRTEARDAEAAHSDEDALRDAVASGHPYSVELARIALSTRDIEFERWCA